jgi:hypothetical protein
VISTFLIKGREVTVCCASACFAKWPCDEAVSITQAGQSKGIADTMVQWSHSRFCRIYTLSKRAIAVHDFRWSDQQRDGLITIIKGAAKQISFALRVVRT